MIIIQPSATADSRTCDVLKVSKKQLLLSSKQHVNDVMRCMLFFSTMLLEAGITHDFDKFSEIDQFYSDFKTNFATTSWWDNHRKINRHHLNYADGVPNNVNLVDVIEMIVDCVVAGIARSGKVYPLEIESDILIKAFYNTVELLKSQIVINDKG